MTTKMVTFRADEELKTEFDKVAKKLAIPSSAMYTAFMQQVVNHQGIPFELKSETDLSRKEMNERISELLKDRIEEAKTIDLTNKEEIEKLLEGWDEW